MREPIRLHVIKALQTLLKGVTPAAGYANDLSAAVFVGRNAFGREEPDTLVSVLEKPSEGEGLLKRPDPSKLETVLKLYVQGWAPLTAAGELDLAYGLAADVVQCLGKEYRRASGRARDFLGLSPSGQAVVTELLAGAPTVRPPAAEDGSAGQSAMFWMEVHITYVENRLDPWVDSQV